MNKFTYTDMLAALGISSAHPGGSILTKKVLANEKITDTMKVLDIGCGTGFTTSFIVKKFKCEVVAIDTHTTMIEKARKRFDKAGVNCKLIKANVEKLPFSSDIFDLVIAESVLIFTNTNKSLKEISKVLKKSGKLIAIEMTAENSFSEAEKNEIFSAYGINRLLTEQEWKNQFLRAGFKDIVIQKDKKTDSEDFFPDKNDPSDYIDPRLFEILQTHTSLLQKFDGRLGYRIFHCTK